MSEFNLSFSTLEDTRLSDAAYDLGKLLEKTPQYARYIELSRAVAQDAQVTALLSQIRTSRSFYVNREHSGVGRDLQAELEALPLMRSYRQSEIELRGLLGAVDLRISRSAGVTFAANVPESGCG